MVDAFSPSRRMDRWSSIKIMVFILALVPALLLFARAMFDQLGANPAEALIRASGDWALRFLCLALAVTPVRIVVSLPALARLRRMVGLFCFFYAFSHACLYAGLDMGWDWQTISADIGKRPFILVGFSAWCLLLMLALTSWDGAVRWLGGRRWRAVHRVVFLVAPLAVLHFYWMRKGKNNFDDVWLYAGILAVLLLFRCAKWWVNKRVSRME